MTDFATWLREWADREATQGLLDPAIHASVNDLAALCAQMYEALEEGSPVRQPHLGRAGGVACGCKSCDALRAAEEFMEKYRD